MRETIYLVRSTIYLMVLLFLGACSHPLDEPWLDKKSPKSHSISRLNCERCHDLTIECNACHFGSSGSKTPSDWIHGMTPHGDLVASGPVCNTCHTLTRIYGNGPASCHDCHSLPGFHVTGEAWLNKTSPDFHGDSTLTCAGCHDLGTKCVECHFDATGSKSPPDWTHGNDSHNDMSASGPVCNSCHALNRGYGNGPESCHDCHGVPDSHVTGEAWLNRTSPDFHGSSTLSCADCHDLSTECNACHFGASGSMSPPDWTHGTDSHDQLEAEGEVCNTCHALNRGYGNGPESCHDCHALNTHEVPFSGHELQAISDPVSCQECHGADLNGGSGPACSECHTADSPLTALNCTSCHGKPPTGGSSPNMDGSHTVHNLLAGVTGVCTVCHQGAGTQTAKHYDTVVDVAFSGYNASSGTASYDAGSDTCSQVSCHGGKNTRTWFSGSIDVKTECGVCHSSGGEYNSYVSGEHDKHVRGEGHPCTECHDTSKLQTVHFNDLGTPQMNQAAQTIRDELNYNGQYCLFTCHFGNENKQHDNEERW